MSSKCALRKFSIFNLLQNEHIYKIYIKNLICLLFVLFIIIIIL